MKAAVLTAVDTPLEVRDDIEIASPGPGEVRIEGLAPGAYRLFFATPDSCGTAIPAEVGADGLLGFEMPDIGVLTATALDDLDPAFLTDATSSRCPHG